MNRELKFRAWDKVNKRMYDVGSIEFIDRIEGRPGVNVFTDSTHNYPNKWMNYQECVLIQFTGLYAQEDKPIYEGDIVRVLNDDEPYVVKYIDDYAMFVAEHPWSDHQYNLDEVVCVIGNIYENPKLIHS